VAVGTLSLFDRALRIYHLLEPVFPVFSPIIYVITYSDGLCHPKRPFINRFQDNWSNLLLYIDFAIVIQPHDITGLAPAEVDLGYLPRMLFDWEARFRKPLSYKNRMLQ
jgi:hypothetical protein